ESARVRLRHWDMAATCVHAARPGSAMKASVASWSSAAALVALTTLVVVAPVHARTDGREIGDLIPEIVLGALDTSIPAIAAGSVDDVPLVAAAVLLDPVGSPDPLEPVNRATFAFNLRFDRFVYVPITGVYRFIVPTPARRALRRALVNLDMPVTFVNDL